MNRIHIYTENVRQYYVDQETNQFYITIGAAEVDKKKITKCSSLGAISAPVAVGLCRLCDGWYIPVSSIGSNIFLISILIVPCLAIYLELMKKQEQLKDGQEPFPVILDEWKKEELLKKSLKGSRMILIFTGASSVIAIGLGIKFMISSETIFYTLTAAIFMMLALLLPFIKLIRTRIKVIKEMQKKYYN